jgi:hypothetical protein
MESEHIKLQLDSVAYLKTHPAGALTLQPATHTGICGLS